MARKQPQPQPAREKPFSNQPFAALKGVLVESPRVAAPEPVQPVVTPAPRQGDDELFLQAMNGVQRLEPPARPGKKQPQQPAAGRSRQQPRQEKKSLPRDEVLARKDFLQAVKKLQLDVRFEDRLPDDELRPLSGNRLRQLKRGIIRLERQLDLHGLTRDEALEALAAFLVSARQAGEKGVLVITGKGLHSSEGPVLQQTVAAWLRDQGRELITEYAPAPPELGGGGALVIFVRPLDKASGN